MPSASVLGNVWNDVNGDGARQGNEPGLAGQTVFLDLNHDGKLGTTTTTIAAPSTAISAADAGSVAAFGGVGSALQVQGLPSKILNVAVGMDLVNNSPDAVQVLLISPLGFTVPQLPVLFTVQPGQHFVGGFDGNSTNPVTRAPNPVPDGTYAPQQAFTSPQEYIESGDPNGTWALVFFPPSAGDVADLHLNSWSLTITSPEPSAQTDAAGNYSFTGLDAGTYSVRLAPSAADVVTAPAGAAQAVTVADGQAATGVDFGVQPAPDLTSVSFALAAPATAWGQPVTIRYTLTNQGAGDAPAFDVGLYLSANGTISTGGPLLETLHLDGLAAGASTSGSVTVPLPAGPPPGFGPLSTAYAGLVIDPAGAVPDANRANNSNQGAGIDLALLGAQTNVSVAAGAGVQQAPSVAVDPADPSHLVTAYMDYSLLKTGYAGIGVAVSHDGGQSWTNTSVPLPAGFDQGAAAPSVAFDAQGHVYVSFMAATFLGPQPALTNPDSSQRLDGFQSNNGIFVARSTDGGLSWGQPTAVVQNVYKSAAVPFDSYPALAVDTDASSPYHGNLYVAWNRFYPAGQFPGDPGSTDGSDVLVAVSADGGSSWATQMQDLPGTGAGTGRVSAIHDPFFGASDRGDPGRGLVGFPSVTVGAGGAVFVATYTGGFFTVYASTNGGRSLSTPGGLVSGFTTPNIFGYLGTPFDFTFNQVLTDSTLDGARTIPTRQIVADPAHPGVVYAVAANALDQAANGAVSANGIVFATSTDYGQNWTSNFTVGSEPSPLGPLTPGQVSTFFPVLNDDNAGQYPGFAASPPSQVVSHQAIPHLAVDAQGNVTVIWYDTRGDASGQDVAVWGTVSTDGGQHFGPNFRVSGPSFDPAAGGFTTATGQSSNYLGDQIGLAAADGTAYAVWTDTRGGNQDVYFGSYALTPAPQPPADRFSPNDTPQTATDLGKITAPQVVPRLTLPPGSADEWFRLQAGAAGDLSVSVTAASGGTNLQLALTDANGNRSPATVTDVRDASGAVVGKELVIHNQTAGQTYLVHVSAQADTATTYTLTAQALTGDLGAQVQGSKGDTLLAGGQDIFRYTAPLTGTLQVGVHASALQGSGLNVAILAPDGQRILASSLAPLTTTDPDAQLSLPVTQGEVLLFQVSAADMGSSGGFTLQFTNLDQYETSGARGTTIDGSVSDARVAAPSLPNKDYAVTVGVGGTLQVTVAAGGGFAGALKVRVINADKTALLAGSVLVPSGGSAQLVVPSVAAGQTVFVRVSGVGLNAGDQADYTLQLSNLDAAASSGITTLFFPTVGDPTSIAAANLTGDSTTDLLVSNTDASDALGVLLANGDGTFQAERQFDVGPGLSGLGLSAGNRQLAVADLNGDGKPDVIVPNFRAGDVSILNGRGDGTFAPQRVSNAVPSPDAMVTGKFTADGNTDAVVLEDFAQGGGVSSFAFLHGRGDGNFAPPVFYPTVFTNGAGPMVVGDFNGDGKLDLIVFSKNESVGQIFFGNGDGAFRGGNDTFATGENTFNAAAVDLNGDGKLDLVTTGTNFGNVYVQLGNGDGTFQAAQSFPAMPAPPGQNVGVNGLAVVDFGSPDPSGPGSPDGHPDLVVTAASRSGAGAAEVLLLPGLVDGQGHYAGFGAPVVLATVGAAGNIAVGDFTGDGATDLAVADKGGVTVLYGKPPALAPNTSPTTARDLGSVAHLVTIPQAVVAGHKDAYYTYTVPTETAAGSGSEVVDFSALFQYVGGAGLQMQITDARTGQVLGTGDRLRIPAAQGEVLTVHVSGLPGSVPGFGAYTLDIDVLPQVVSAQAESPVPGGPATSIVLTLQGDRLDPAAAQDPANYTVTWLGPNGPAAPGEAQVIPVASTAGAQPVVYNPGANVDVASGLAYPAAVRQTVTLLFTQPLPEGSYLIQLSPDVHAAPFSGSEAGLLADEEGVGGHEVVSQVNGTVQNGSALVAAGLVAPAGTTGDTSALAQGTPFLTQLQNDLDALLNQELAAKGDDPSITAVVNQQIQARFAALYAAAAQAGLPSSFTIFWLDPVSLDVQAPQGQRASYNLQSNSVSNNLGQTYVDVAGNVEVVVVANAAGSFQLGVGDVPPTARGGAVALGPTTAQVLSFTDALRAGTTGFTVTVPQAPGAQGGNPGSVPASSPAAVAANTGPAAATAGPGQVASAATPQQTAAALAAVLLTGLPANAVPAGATTAPAGATSTAAGSTVAVAPAGAASGGGDELPPPGFGTLRGVVDKVLQEWLPAVAVPARDGVSSAVTPAVRILEQAAAEVASFLPDVGWQEVPLPEVRWQELINNLIRSGVSAAEALGKQLRSHTPAPAPAGGAVPAGTAAPEESPDEARFPEAGPPEVRMLVQPLQKAEGYWGVMLFLAGAYHAGRREATGAPERDRRKRRAP